MIRLAELRKERGLTQRQFAEKFGISGGNVCDYEKGRIEPSISRMIEFADFFEVSLDYLLGRSDFVGNVNVSTHLSAVEEELLDAIKCLGNDEQQRVLGYVSALRDVKRARK